MTEPLVIKSGTSDLSLTVEAGGGEAPEDRFERLSVTIDSRRLRASARVYNFHPERGVGDLASFFEGLAAGRLGWRGERRWESADGDFKLVCTHDATGGVRIAVELREDAAGGFAWRARCDLLLDLGQLDSLAKEVRRFFSR